MTGCTRRRKAWARCAAAAACLSVSAGYAAPPTTAPVLLKIDFSGQDAELPSSLSLASGLHLQASMKSFDSTLYSNRSYDDVEGRLQMLSFGPLFDTVPLSSDSHFPLRLGFNLGVMLESSSSLRHPAEGDPRDGLMDFRAYPAATMSMSWRF